MASTTSIGRAKCKCNVAGKVCTCQEWEPSEEDEQLCECCEHHMSFHEPLHPTASGYGRCVREFDDAGSSHEDGCQEFFPSCASNSRICAGCVCHRNYHEKVTVVVGELAGSSNVRFQQQDSLSGDPSESSLHSNSKGIRLDPTIILTEEESELQAAGFGHDLKNESDMADLEPKHKVFLSHSGAQKDFVEQLCIDLERCDRYPFFDKRRSSLPVGLKFPERLFAAIQQGEVGVVVLSEEFFSKTKWPMLELVEMVRVRSMKIVPVFLGISREVCRNLQSQERWMEQWKEWAKTDKTIDIEEWTLALKIFGSTTGVSVKDGEVSLRREVVDAVCELVLPESRWDDSNVEGKDRLCQVILDKVGLEVEYPEVHVEKGCLEVKDLTRVRVMGLYGVGGIGKTTICKVLCNKLFKEFRGRVCHTELKSASQVESKSANEVELLQEVLKVLTNTRLNDLERMNIDKCKDQLRRCIVKQPVFLAIDNVDEKSAEQAITYLRAKHFFGNGSLVVVTSRSLGQLEALDIPKNDCSGMPELELREARGLFRNCAKSIGDVEYELDERIITRCVEMCRFQKDGESYHYHPLALTVLGNEVREQVACNNFDPSLWYSRFSRIEESYKVLETKKQIFSILRISYDTLSHDDQMLFIDVALFVRNLRRLWDSYSYFYLGPYFYEWLGMVHGFRKHGELKARLERLQKKSLLEKVGNGSTDVVMHDLWREFCVAETEAGRFAERRWVYFEEGCNELGESSPSGSCWEKLERMYFLSEAGVQKFLGLRLDHFSNVKVLRVRGKLIARDPGFVDLGKMIHLKYLELPFMGKIEVRGLQSLTELAFLEWSGMPDVAGYAEDIGCLTNLQFLKLPFFRASTLPDMSKLTSLETAFFMLSEVETITGLTGKLTNLQYLNLARCEKLRSCPGVCNLVGLKSLDISRCKMLEELPNLGKLTNLMDLDMNGCSSLRVCPGLCGLRKLLRMDISFCSLWSALPSLSDLVSLEELSARDCNNLAEFPDMRNLKKLQVLNILGCPVRTLPGFEGLISLRELVASFELLEDRPALHNFTSLRRVKIEGWNEPGLMGIAKHAMLESLHVDKCEERSLQLNLRNMERLQRLEFGDGESQDILKDLRLTFYDGESEGLCAINACQLKEVNVWDCRNLEVLDLINIPGLQKLIVSGCTLNRLSIREPLGRLRLMNRNGPREWEGVSDLSGFTGLQELDVTVCRRLTSFTSMKPLSALKKLNLSGCDSLEALQDLRYFPHLQTLDLHGCERLRRLNSRVPLLALEKLDLTGCTSLATLPDLSNFPNLRELNLSGCESLTEITSDKPLAALKNLNLRRCRNVQALPDLANFPQLETLDLHRCESLTSFSCSVRLLSLEQFCPHGCISPESLPDLSYFPDLIKLRLLHCKRLIRISSEEPLRALKILQLWRCNSLVALPDLSYFPDLKSLTLRDCERLTSVNCDAPLLALTNLDLGGCISLKHLADLCNFLSLKWLHLERCESLVSLTSSEPLPALFYLNAKRCRSLTALPDHLRGSVKLQHLRVWGSGIELSEDTVSKLLASCVELKSVESSGHILGEDSELDDWDESDCDFAFDWQSNLLENLHSLL